MKRLVKNLLFSISFVLFLGIRAYAGVFDIPYFIEPGQTALGIEPELTLTPESGLGANLKSHHGINHFINGIATVGSSGGNRRFRAGGAVVFDFFPDIDSQPGIGLAAQGLYVNRTNGGRLEVTAIPYIHKAFTHEQQIIDPFFAFPFGYGVRSVGTRNLMQFVGGAHFQINETFRTSLEIGIKVKETHSYVSGGIIFNL
jgi:hypothetical protein